MKVNRKNENGYNSKVTILAIPLYLSTLGIVTLYGLIMNQKLAHILKMNFIVIMFLFTFLIYLRIKPVKTLFQNSNLKIALIGYILSMVFLIMNDKIYNLPIWLIGTVLIALCLDMNLGILVHMMYCLLLSLTGSMAVENIIFVFILGFLCCMLVKYLTTITNLISISIILVSCNFIFILLRHEMILQSEVFKEWFISGICLVVILVTAFYLLHRYSEILFTGNSDLNGGNQEFDFTVLAQRNGQNIQYDFKDKNIRANSGKNSDEGFSAEDKKLDSRFSQYAATSEYAAYKTKEIKNIDNYERILNDNFILLERLKEVREERYLHAVEVANLSCEVSKYMQADEYLSKAVCLYREICYITNVKNVQKGIRLMEEFSFPEEVIFIIKEQYEDPKHPKSFEALIVFLSESIITTMAYMKEKPEKASIGKARIIENVFNNHLKNGIFDELAISLKDYQRLKDIYISYFKE